MAVFVVFTLTCSGPYGLEDVIYSSGPGLTLLMVLLLPLVWSLPMAFVASELGSMIPEAGGAYRWIRRALGEYWSFQAGWWWGLSNFVDSAVYIALALDYLDAMSRVSTSSTRTAQDCRPFPASGLQSPPHGGRSSARNCLRSVVRIHVRPPAIPSEITLHSAGPSFCKHSLLLCQLLSSSGPRRAGSRGRHLTVRPRAAPRRCASPARRYAPGVV